MNELRDIRQARGFSRAQLAELVSYADRRIDSSLIARFESGLCLPTPRVAQALCEAIGADMEELYGVPEQLYIPAMLASDAPAEPESFEVMDLIQTLSEAGGPVKRGELAALLDVNDRDLRHLIAQARALGYIIVNHGDGRGYYMASSTEDIEQHFRLERKRALTILKGLGAARRVLREEGRI